MDLSVKRHLNLTGYEMIRLFTSTNRRGKWAALAMHVSKDEE
jgi:hypothetical protein